MRLTVTADDVRGMAATTAFSVIHMHGAPGNGSQRILIETRLVQRVGMDHHRKIIFLGRRERAVDRRRHSAIILMDFYANNAAI